jgi:hypothetical protein
MMSLAAQPPQESAFEMLGIKAIGFRASVLSWHGDTRPVDDICIDVPCSQPSCQPEPISAGLESKSNTVDYSPRLDRLPLPPVHQCQQRIFVRWNAKSIDEICDKLVRAALCIERNPKMVRSMTSFPYIINAL